MVALKGHIIRPTFSFMMGELQGAKSFLCGIIHYDSKRSVLKIIKKDHIAKFMYESILN